MMGTYFDFADDDRRYFMEDYEIGRIANYMGSMAQNICERYMKHIIEVYVMPKDLPAEYEKEALLRTQNLDALTKYLDKMGYSFRKETREEMQMIDGFYFSTRYPGDDSYMLDKEEIKKILPIAHGRWSFVERIFFHLKGHNQEGEGL